MKRQKGSDIKMKFPKNKRLFVLGYGSLLYPDGINGRWMVHEYKWKDLSTAILKGFERGWYAEYKNKYLFYGLIKKTDSYLNGTIFEVHSDFDFKQLSISECIGEMYKWVDVTDKVEPRPKNCKIFTCVVIKKPKSFEGLIKYPRYEGNCDDGMEHWGKKFVKEFEKTTKQFGGE